MIAVGFDAVTARHMRLARKSRHCMLAAGQRICQRCIIGHIGGDLGDLGAVGRTDRTRLRWRCPVIGMIWTYIYLVANLVILYDIEQMSRVLSELRNEDIENNPEMLAGLSPYRTSHINRVGSYTVETSRTVTPIDFTRRILSEANEAASIRPSDRAGRSRRRWRIAARRARRTG